jgi:hypothetical protein
MNKFFGSINHPELYHKKNVNPDISYTIAVACSAVIYETPSTPNSINWKLI